MRILSYSVFILMTLAVILNSGCKGGHQHGHKIISLPYAKNVGYFDKVCDPNVKGNKCWRHKWCNQNERNLSYMPFFCGNSKRPEFRDRGDSFYIFVPYYSSSMVFHAVINDVNNDPIEGQESISEKRGTFGCNYFLAGGDDDAFLVSSGLKSTDSAFYSVNKINRKQCSLDFFEIDTLKYINLLFILHDDHLEAGDGPIERFTNVDFAISNRDYTKLDSLLQIKRNIIGGIDSTNKNKMYLYLEGSLVKFDSIISPQPPLFTYFPIQNLPYRVLQQ